MHLVGENEAWVTPPRTATKTILHAIGLEHVVKGQTSAKWHYVDPSLLGDRKLCMSIRNPYTRIQSHWRMFYNSLMGIMLVTPETKKKIRARNGIRPTMQEAETVNISLRDYILILDGKLIKREDHVMHIMNDSVQYREVYPYPLPLVDHLRGIPVERVDHVVRQERLVDDMLKLGYHVKTTYIEPVDKQYYVGLSWFKKNPDCAEIVYRHYKKDFDAFGYEPICT